MYRLKLPNNVIGLLSVSFALLLLSGCGSDSTPNPFTALTGDTGGGGETSTWQMVWNDEFNGTALNTANWGYDIGAGGWGNGELQYYQQDNATVSGGFLTIEAREESVGGEAYTSARILTAGKQSFRFGKIEIRAKLPAGQGIWPALWMLGDSFSGIGWPYSGEIDITEMIGGSGRENTVHGTIHWDNSGHRSSGGSSTLTSGTFADDFHVFSIEWDSASIKWYVDGVNYHTESISSPDKSELQEAFFFIFNVAVGGAWPGNPDVSTSFPQQMAVDYIRVYEAL